MRGAAGVGGFGGWQIPGHGMVGSFTGIDRWVTCPPLECAGEGM
jgi:hypothetical protein